MRMPCKAVAVVWKLAKESSFAYRQSPKQPENRCLTLWSLLGQKEHAARIFSGSSRDFVGDLPTKTLEGKNLDDDLSFHAYLSLLDPHDWTFVQTSPVEIGCVGLCKSSGSRQICFALDG